MPAASFVGIFVMPMPYVTFQAGREAAKARLAAGLFGKRRVAPAPALGDRHPEGSGSTR